MVKNKSLPGAILGIIGAVLAIIGGIMFVACADIADGLTGSSFTWAAWVFGIGSGVIAIVGAVMDFRNNIIGGILLFVAVVFAIVVCIVMYWSVLMIIAFILLAVGGVLSFVVKKPV